MEAPMCKCPHHKVAPVALMLIGLVFLLGTLGVLTNMQVSLAWPILLLIIGMMKLGGCKCCNK